MPFIEKVTELNRQTPLGETVWLGSAAGRALDALMSTVYSSVTQAWLTKQMVDYPSGTGLHIDCGDGSLSFLLAALIGRSCCLTGIDEDPVLIEKALIRKKYSAIDNIHFTHSKLESLCGNGEFDFIFSQLGGTDIPVKIDEWIAVAKQLKKGGILLLQVVDFSTFHSYPYNNAFARSVELIGKLTELSLQGTVLQDFIEERLRTSGFEACEKSFSSPAFLHRDSHHMLSLFLECCRVRILAVGLVSREEFNSLLLELKEHEAQPDTMITRPGMYHFRAKKSDLAYYDSSDMLTPF